VVGAVTTLETVPAIDLLVQRALSHRSEYITEQRQINRFRLEQRAAERLRIAEPMAIAGLKRGDVAPGRTETSSAVGITIHCQSSTRDRRRSPVGEQNRKAPLLAATRSNGAFTRKSLERRMLSREKKRS